MGARGSEFSTFLRFLSDYRTVPKKRGIFCGGGGHFIYIISALL